MRLNGKFITFLFSGDTEQLLGLDKYLATAKCTQESSVYWIHKEYFDRLFRKKNPGTLKPMAKTLCMLMKNRAARESLASRVPLLKCLIFKLQEMTGEIKPKTKKDQEEENPLAMIPESHTALLRGKAGYSVKSFPIMRRGSAHYSVSSFRSAQLPSSSGGYLGAGRSVLGHPGGLVYSMPNPLTAAAMQQQHQQQQQQQTEGQQVPERPSNRRDGIFLKLMQVGNMSLNRKHLDIEEDELQYLISLRRRIARQMEEFHPMSSMDALYGDSAGGRRRNRGRQRLNSTGKVLPALKGGRESLTATGGRGQGTAGGGRGGHGVGGRGTHMAAKSAPAKRKQRGILFKIT